MTFPNIPNVTPSITVNRNEVVDLLLGSIAFEVLGLAHIINSEAEKIQAVLGPLPGVSLTVTSVSQLLSANQSVEQTLKTVIKKEMLLQFKLEEILKIPPESTTSTTSITTSTTSTKAPQRQVRFLQRVQQHLAQFFTIMEAEVFLQHQREQRLQHWVMLHL